MVDGNNPEAAKDAPATEASEARSDLNTSLQGQTENVFAFERSTPTTETSLDTDLSQASLSVSFGSEVLAAAKESDYGSLRNFANASYGAEFNTERTPEQERFFQEFIMQPVADGLLAGVSQKVADMNLADEDKGFVYQAMTLTVPPVLKEAAIQDIRESYQRAATLSVSENDQRVATYLHGTVAA